MSCKAGTCLMSKLIPLDHIIVPLTDFSYHYRVALLPSSKKLGKL